MHNRSVPYTDYNYVVYLGNPQGAETPFGSFSEVSGLDRHQYKLPGLHKVGDVTLKRGLVNSNDLSAWLAAGQAAVGREFTVTLLDGNRTPMTSWRLSNAIPIKFTGPTLSGKGAGDVAVEELILSTESIEFVPQR